MKPNRPSLGATKVGIVCLLTLALMPAAYAARGPAAGRKALPVDASWVGISGDDALRVTALNGANEAIITTQDALAKVFKSWRPDEPAPMVDFTKNLVFIVTVGGPNRIAAPSPAIDEGGNVAVVAASTRMAGPGFGYAILSLPLQGVKSINGKPLPGTMGKPVTGTIEFPAGAEIPAGALVTVRLVDVALADAAARELGKQVIESAAKSPLAFSVSYDPAAITDRSDCAIQVRVERDGKLLFITDTRFSVLTRGRPVEDVKVKVISTSRPN